MFSMGMLNSPPTACFLIASGAFSSRRSSAEEQEQAPALRRPRRRASGARTYMMMSASRALYCCRGSRSGCAPRCVFFVRLAACVPRRQSVELLNRAPATDRHERLLLPTAPSAFLLGRTPMVKKEDMLIPNLERCGTRHYQF
ncbi:unnamed protein product [Ectocarpus fasciculatus]